MEIEYRTGCLVDAARRGHVQALGHGCNCFCTMNSGIAPQIARQYPEVQDVDHTTKKGDIKKLGSVTFVVREEHPHLIFNIYTQFHYGHDGKVYSDYKAIESGMHLVNANIKAHNELEPQSSIVYVGFPKIGCGLGGADWDKVAAIIERSITAAKPVVYTLEK